MSISWTGPLKNIFQMSLRPLYGQEYEILGSANRNCNCSRAFMACCPLTQHHVVLVGTLLCLEQSVSSEPSTSQCTSWSFSSLVVSSTVCFVLEPVNGLRRKYATPKLLSFMHLSKFILTDMTVKTKMVTFISGMQHKTMFTEGFKGRSQESLCAKTVQSRDTWNRFNKNTKFFLSHRVYKNWKNYNKRFTVCYREISFAKCLKSAKRSIMFTLLHLSLCLANYQHTKFKDWTSSEILESPFIPFQGCSWARSLSFVSRTFNLERIIQRKVLNAPVLLLTLFLTLNV